MFDPQTRSQRERAFFLVYFHQDAAVFGFGWVGPEGFAGGAADHRAGWNVKAPLVPRAVDVVAVEPALGQPGGMVGADCRGGEDLAIDIVEEESVGACLDLHPAAGGEGCAVGDVYPSGAGHGLTMAGPSRSVAPRMAGERAS